MTITAKELIVADDRTLAEEAVTKVAEYLSSIKLIPTGFSAQMALCQLFEIADEDRSSDVAQWILSTPRERLWKRDHSGMFTEGDEPIHVLFRAAWENYRFEQLPVM